MTHQQAGQDQGPVDDRPEPPRGLKGAAPVLGQPGDGLAPASPPADRQRVLDGAIPRDGEEPVDFLLGQRSASPSRVGVGVRLLHPVERIGGKPLGLDAPVGERDGGGLEGIAGARRPTPFDLLGLAAQAHRSPPWNDLIVQVMRSRLPLGR